MEILGIDIGGSGIKGAPVNIETGYLITERYRIETPSLSTPDMIANSVAQIVHHFQWHEQPIGCAFPSVIKQGVAYTAANIDDSWIGTNGEDLIRQKTACPVTLLNDADAAGMAEMRFGAGKDRQGVVIMLTLGTGIGTAIFIDGKLLPNTEFGHLQIRGKDAEHRASSRVRTEKKLGWKKWAMRLNEFLAQMDALFFPDLFIIGGGVSRKQEHFLPLLKTRAEIVPAQLRNQAGIVGAALAAAEVIQTK